MNQNIHLEAIQGLPQPWMIGSRMHGMVTLSAESPSSEAAPYDGSKTITLTLDQIVALITEAITPLTNMANELKARVDAMKGAALPELETLSATPRVKPLFGLARSIAANQREHAARGK